MGRVAGSAPGYALIRNAQGTCRMEVNLTLNGQPQALAVEPNELLMTALRRNGLFSVKHGCETGECGSCTVLIDGKPTVSCLVLAATLEGREVSTLESLAIRPQEMHPLQQSFVETGAIQCGYCTPGQILCAKALLDK